jgi:hypothetical protein
LSHSQAGAGLHLHSTASLGVPSGHLGGAADWARVQRLTWLGEGSAGAAAYAAADVARSLAEVEAHLAAARGFTAVVDALTAARVPVVGHTLNEVTDVGDRDGASTDQAQGVGSRAGAQHGAVRSHDQRC